jgi:DNA-binding response OmpR family regulator
MGRPFPRSKVLVVHEDVVSLSYYRDIFEGLGLKVVTQNSYAAGLACLDAEDFGLIVVSQGGRAFEGGCILERLREIKRHTSVLVVTRRRDSAAYLKSWELGAAGYLKEPVPVSEIVRLAKARLSLPSRQPDVFAPSL